MELYPAIDLIDSHVVRLRRGEFGDVTVFDDRPAAFAQRFAAAGASWLHVIDLDAARTGARGAEHAELLGAITQAKTAKLQVGGGFRSAAAVEAALAAGIDRCLIGTLAVREPETVAALAAAHGSRICVTADSLGGSVRVSGWLEDSALDTVALVRTLSGLGVAVFLVTAIDRDGTGEGPDLDLLARVRSATDGMLVASGGVGCLADIEAVRELGCDGVVVGRALLDGTIAVQDAVAACGTIGPNPGRTVSSHQPREGEQMG